MAILAGAEAVVPDRLLEAGNVHPGRPVKWQAAKISMLFKTQAEEMGGLSEKLAGISGKAVPECRKKQNRYQPNPRCIR